MNPSKELSEESDFCVSGSLSLPQASGALAANTSAASNDGAASSVAAQTPSDQELLEAICLIGSEDSQRFPKSRKMTDAEKTELRKVLCSKNNWKLTRKFFNQVMQSYETELHQQEQEQQQQQPMAQFSAFAAIDGSELCPEGGNLVEDGSPEPCSEHIADLPSSGTMPKVSGIAGSSHSGFVSGGGTGMRFPNAYQRFDCSELDQKIKDSDEKLKNSCHVPGVLDFEEDEIDDAQDVLQQERDSLLAQQKKKPGEDAKKAVIKNWEQSIANISQRIKIYESIIEADKEVKRLLLAKYMIGCLFEYIQYFSLDSSASASMHGSVWSFYMNQSLDFFISNVLPGMVSKNVSCVDNPKMQHLLESDKDTANIAWEQVLQECRRLNNFESNPDSFIALNNLYWSRFLLEGQVTASVTGECARFRGGYLKRALINVMYAQYAKTSTPRTSFIQGIRKICLDLIIRSNNDDEFKELVGIVSSTMLAACNETVLSYPQDKSYLQSINERVDKPEDEKPIDETVWSRIMSSNVDQCALHSRFCGESTSRKLDECPDNFHRLLLHLLKDFNLRAIIDIFRSMFASHVLQDVLVKICDIHLCLFAAQDGAVFKDPEAFSHFLCDFESLYTSLQNHQPQQQEQHVMSVVSEPISFDFYKSQCITENSAIEPSLRCERFRSFILQLRQSQRSFIDLITPSSTSIESQITTVRDQVFHKNRRIVEVTDAIILSTTKLATMLCSEVETSGMEDSESLFFGSESRFHQNLPLEDTLRKHLKLLIVPNFVQAGISAEQQELAKQVSKSLRRIAWDVVIDLNEEGDMFVTQDGCKSKFEREFRPLKEGADSWNFTNNRITYFGHHMPILSQIFAKYTSNSKPQVFETFILGFPGILIDGQNTADHQKELNYIKPSSDVTPHFVFSCIDSFHKTEHNMLSIDSDMLSILISQNLGRRVKSLVLPSKDLTTGLVCPMLVEICSEHRTHILPNVSILDLQFCGQVPAYSCTHKLSFHQKLSDYSNNAEATPNRIKEAERSDLFRFISGRTASWYLIKHNLVCRRKTLEQQLASLMREKVPNNNDIYVCKKPGCVGARTIIRCTLFDLKDQFVCAVVEGYERKDTDIIKYLQELNRATGLDVLVYYDCHVLLSKWTPKLTDGLKRISVQSSDLNVSQRKMSIPARFTEQDRWIEWNETNLARYLKLRQNRAESVFVTCGTPEQQYKLVDCIEQSQRDKIFSSGQLMSQVDYELLASLVQQPGPDLLFGLSPRFQSPSLMEWIIDHKHSGFMLIETTIMKRLVNLLQDRHHGSRQKFIEAATDMKVQYRNDQLFPVPIGILSFLRQSKKSEHTEYFQSVRKFVIHTFDVMQNHKSQPVTAQPEARIALSDRTHNESMRLNMARVTKLCVFCAIFAPGHSVPLRLVSELFDFEESEVSHFMKSFPAFDFFIRVTEGFDGNPSIELRSLEIAYFLAEPVLGLCDPMQISRELPRYNNLYREQSGYVTELLKLCQDNVNYNEHLNLMNFPDHLSPPQQPTRLSFKSVLAQFLKPAFFTNQEWHPLPVDDAVLDTLKFPCESLHSKHKHSFLVENILLQYPNRHGTKIVSTILNDLVLLFQESPEEVFFVTMYANFVQNELKGASKQLSRLSDFPKIRDVYTALRSDWYPSLDSVIKALKDAESNRIIVQAHHQLAKTRQIEFSSPPQDLWRIQHNCAEIFKSVLLTEKLFFDLSILENIWTPEEERNCFVSDDRFATFHESLSQNDRSVRLYDMTLVDLAYVALKSYRESIEMFPSTHAYVGLGLTCKAILDLLPFGFHSERQQHMLDFQGLQACILHPRIAQMLKQEETFTSESVDLSMSMLSTRTHLEGWVDKYNSSEICSFVRDRQSFARTTRTQQQLCSSELVKPQKKKIKSPPFTISWNATHLLVSSRVSLMTRRTSEIKVSLLFLEAEIPFEFSAVSTMSASDLLVPTKWVIDIERLERREKGTDLRVCLEFSSSEYFDFYGAVDFDGESGYSTISCDIATKAVADLRPESETRVHLFEWMRAWNENLKDTANHVRSIALHEFNMIGDPHQLVASQPSSSFLTLLKTILGMEKITDPYNHALYCAHRAEYCLHNNISHPSLTADFIQRRDKTVSMCINLRTNISGFQLNLDILRQIETLDSRASTSLRGQNESGPSGPNLFFNMSLARRLTSETSHDDEECARFHVKRPVESSGIHSDPRPHYILPKYKAKWHRTEKKVAYAMFTCLHEWANVHAKALEEKSVQLGAKRTARLSRPEDTKERILFCQVFFQASCRFGASRDQEMPMYFEWFKRKCDSKLFQADKVFSSFIQKMISFIRPVLQENQHFLDLDYLDTVICLICVCVTGILSKSSSDELREFSLRELRNALAKLTVASAGCQFNSRKTYLVCKQPKVDLNPLSMIARVDRDQYMSQESLDGKMELKGSWTRTSASLLRLSTDFAPSWCIHCQKFPDIDIPYRGRFNPKPGAGVEVKFHLTVTFEGLCAVPTSQSKEQTRTVTNTKVYVKYLSDDVKQSIREHFESAGHVVKVHVHKKNPAFPLYCATVEYVDTQAVSRALHTLNYSRYKGQQISVEEYVDR